MTAKDIDNFKSMDTRGMWKSISAITEHKGRSPHPVILTPAAILHLIDNSHVKPPMLTLNAAEGQSLKAVGPGQLGQKRSEFKYNEVFTDVFNQSLSLEMLPSCLKSAIIALPVLKKANISNMNYYQHGGALLAVSGVFLAQQEEQGTC